MVSGKPGVTNSRGVRDALDVLKTRDIVVPVWDTTTRSGNNTDRARTKVVWLSIDHDDAFSLDAHKQHLDLVVNMLANASILGMAGTACLSAIGFTGCFVSKRSAKSFATLRGDPQQLRRRAAQDRRPLGIGEVRRGQDVVHGRLRPRVGVVRSHHDLARPGLGDEVA